MWGSGMPFDERDYYLARAEQELSAASVASDSTAAAIHANLAKLFMQKAEASSDDDDFSSPEEGPAADFGGDEGNFHQTLRFGPA